VLPRAPVALLAGVYLSVMNIRSMAKVMLKARKIYSDERLFFENVMIPAFGLFNVRNILFVGVAPYTWHYSKLFKRNGIVMHSLDCRPEAAVWGAKGNHVTGDVLNVRSLLGDVKFDLVILMGVIGYGLNKPDDIRDTYDAVSDVLADDGRILMACESKFGLDPLLIAEGCRNKFIAMPSYCFCESIKLQEFDYGFYFLARQN